MRIKQITDFINKNQENSFITGGVSKEIINKIEDDLSVKLPESYKWFLRTYGMLGIYGVEILGCGKSLIPSVVKETKRFRALGIPNNYVVFRNCDEWVYCLDVDSIEDGDCNVVCWDVVIGFKGIETNGFYDYLLNSIKEGEILWNEDV